MSDPSHKSSPSHPTALPTDATDGSWDDLQEPPTEEELALAAQLAEAMEQTRAGSAPLALDVSSTSRDARELDALFSFANLLRHDATPPALDAERHKAIEEALWGSAATEIAIQTAQTAQTTQAALSAQTDETTAHSIAPPIPTASPRSRPNASSTGFWETLGQWLWGHRLLTAAGAFAVLFSLNSTGLFAPLRPAPKMKTHQESVEHTTRPLASEAMPTKLAAHWQSSPWSSTQNPFDSTRSSSERLERVLDHLSHTRQELSLSQVSSQLLMRSRF